MTHTDDIISLRDKAQKIAHALLLIERCIARGNYEKAIRLCYNEFSSDLSVFSKITDAIVIRVDKQILTSDILAKPILTTGERYCKTFTEHWESIEEAPLLFADEVSIEFELRELSRDSDEYKKLEQKKQTIHLLAPEILRFLNDFLLRFENEIRPYFALTKQQPTTSTKGRLENNFDSTPPEDVYAHFHNCLFQKGHLTEKELREFLSAAFQDMKPLEQKLELKNIQKSKAYALFYHYFKVVAKRNTRGNQPRYAALLGDYFAGFNTDSVSKNFSTEYTNQMKAEYGLIS